MLPCRREALLMPLVLLCAGAAAAGDPPGTAADIDVRKLIAREDAYAAMRNNDGNLDPQAFSSENMTLYRWYDLSELYPGASSGSDCWGYVSATNREYAIACSTGGYTFIEVTDPNNTTIVDRIAGPSGYYALWHDVKVLGDYAYGVSEAGWGVQVMDLSDIDNGNVTHVRNVTQQGHSSSHNIVVNTDSGYLYVVGGNIQNGGLVAFSTADPANPNIVGAWGDMYVHDAQVVTYQGGQYDGMEIAFCLSGFNGGWSQTGLRIVDCTNKANMHTISNVSWAGARYAHQGWLSEDRQYLYVNDELDEGDTVNVTTSRVFDVSDLTNPVFMGIFTTGLPAIDHNLYTHNGMIFESNYRSGLRVFDATDPVSPTQVAWFDTYPENDGTGYDGTWSNYPYLPSGTILISDMNRGFFVVSLDLACTADFNGDGTVNTQDVLAFLNAWNAGDASADVNGDGEINTIDVLFYLNLWNAGC